MRILQVVTCLLLCFCFQLVITHKALDIYDKHVFGSLPDFPKFLMISKVSEIAFNSDFLEGVFPCSEEPYFLLMTLHNRGPTKRFIVPYLSPYEGPHGDYFRFTIHGDESIKAKYIGPVSTKIFPPPIKDKDDLGKYLIEFYSKLDEEGASSDSFYIDVSTNYEFPQDGHYLITVEYLVFEYDPETEEFVKKRLEGAAGIALGIFNAVECHGAKVQVNPINEITEFRSLSSEEEQQFSSALAEMKKMASDSVEFLQDLSCPIRQALLRDWFGFDAARDYYVYFITRVFEKIQEFHPSVVELHEEEEFLRHIPIDPYVLDRYKGLNRIPEEGEIRERILEDQTALKEHANRCTPGTVSWLLPKDVSSTIHLCPVFFELSTKEQAFYLMDSVVRFEHVLGAVDYDIGEHAIHQLAQEKDTSACINNAGTYPNFAKRASPNSEEVLIDASV